MNYSLKIKMTYNGLGVNPDGDIERYVQADMQDVNMISEAVSYGRRKDRLSGKVIINNNNGDFDAFDTYYSDSGYYVSPQNFEITELKLNGEDILYNRLALTRYDKVNREIEFKLFGDCFNEYTNIYSSWSTKRNILAGVSSPSGPVKNVAILDVRTLYDTGTTSVSEVINGQTTFESFVNDLIDSETDKQIIRVQCTNYNSMTKIATFDLHWRQWRADGYDNGGDYEPPAGADWEYRTYVGGVPKYKKRPKFLNVNFVEWNGASTDQYITIENECNIVYGLSGVHTNRTLEDVLEYLFSEADNSLTFNWSGAFGMPGAGTFKGDSYFMRDTMLFAMSDFIPTDQGNQKEVAATKGYLSLEIIWRYLEQMGYYWYIDDPGGTNLIKIGKLQGTISGSSNPTINEYISNSENIELLDAEYDKWKNDTTSSTYDFAYPEYKVQNGEKNKSYTEGEIITDVDYILDQKENVFDDTSGNQWVLVSTTQDASNLYYYVRYFTSSLTGAKVNNYEHSFYFLSKNILPQPVLVGDDGTNFGQSQLFRNQVKITLPVNNPQTDFTFYDPVVYYDYEARIQRIEKKLLETEAELTLRLR